MAIEPDTKNWTWVLDARCQECGYDGRAATLRDVPALVRENARAWPSLLSRDGVRDRPNDTTWSTLEYAAHVRDVFRTFEERLRLMQAEDAPVFPNWDQDATAVAERYSEQDPSRVAAELTVAAESVAAAFEAVRDDELDRRGLRSDGSEFTIATLGRYFVHDPIHHLHDVQPEGRRGRHANE